MAERRRLPGFDTTEEIDWNTPGFTQPGARVDEPQGEGPGAPPGWTNPYPGSSFGNNPSGVINRQNPTADPGLPFVQRGETGGYDARTGKVTRKAGDSRTQAEYDAFMDDARNSEWGGSLDEWLSRNPEDPHRFKEAMMSDGGGPSDKEEFRSMFGGMKGMGGGNGSSSDLTKALQGLWGGGVNQDIINRRVSNASDTLNRFRKSQTATNQAALANRGLIGSGPEATASESLETSIADRFANAVNDIYADESREADRRMMDALGLSSGLESNREALGLQRELGLGRLGLDETLGLGSLALGNLNAINSYNLGLGRLGLDRDLGMAGLENADLDRLIKLIEDWINASEGDARGYI